MLAQLNLFEEFDENKFHFTEDILNEACRIGSGIEQGKTRIYNYLTAEHIVSDEINFLMKEYGIGGSSVTGKYKNLWNWHDSKGITLSYRYTNNEREEITMNWNEVLKRIKRLIANGDY